jgi:uncharacterized protein (TIGR03084 family)
VPTGVDLTSAARLVATCADLGAETSDLAAMVSPLPAGDWALPTPAPGWTIAHQIAHLAWTDDTSRLAVTDPTGFAELVQQAIREGDGFVDRQALARAEQAPRELMAGWLAGHVALVAALEAVPTGTKVAWFGPPMSAMSMATARLMETWAHGQDVADSLGIARVPTARIRHVAHLGVRTRDYAYSVHQRQPPAMEFRVELTGPGGELWTWGPDDAAQRVTGPAVDFCLLVTQRRHRADLAIVAIGEDAEEWLDIAQAFAGTPGRGRASSIDSGGST